MDAPKTVSAETQGPETRENFSATLRFLVLAHTEVSSTYHYFTCKLITNCDYHVESRRELFRPNRSRKDLVEKGFFPLGP